jgi:hypothetical protein
VAISTHPIETLKIETQKLWKRLSGYFNPSTNYQVLALLQNEDHYEKLCLQRLD